MFFTSYKKIGSGVFNVFLLYSIMGQYILTTTPPPLKGGGGGEKNTKKQGREKMKISRIFAVNQ